MVNLENELTVDDLIVEYMMRKVCFGYEPQFLISEFMTFLDFFQTKKEVNDVLDNGEELFKRFFDRRTKKDWLETPHMNMEYSIKDGDYLIKANGKFSCYDKSVINTYFMDKKEVKEIRNIIQEFLNNYPKRILDESIKPNNAEIEVGKYVAAQIVLNIWDSYIDKNIKAQLWPKQCRDINKYLFEMDLAKIIDIESIKDRLIEVYKAFSKRIGIMFSQNKNLKISSCYGSYLAVSNYKLLIKDYEDIMSTTFGEHKKNLDVDFSSFEFRESHEISGVYYYDEDPDFKTSTSEIGNNKAKKIVRIIEKNF